jgi:predicted aspartyl protease
MSLIQKAVVMVITSSISAACAAECSYTTKIHPVSYSSEMSLIVNAEVNNVQVRTVPDSGSSIFVLKDTSPAATGLATSASKTPLVTLHGNLESEYAKVDLKIFDDAPFQVPARVVKTLPFNIDSDGIIGANELFRSVLELDLLKKKIVTYQFRGCSSVEEVDELQKSQASKMYLLPLSRLADGRLTLPVSVNGIPMVGLIDTGSRWTSIFDTSMRKIGEGVRSSGNVGNGPNPIQLLENAENGSEEVNLDVAGFNYSKVKARIVKSPAGRRYFDIILGLDWIVAHKIVFFSHQGRMLVSEDQFAPFSENGPANLENWIVRLANEGVAEASFELAKAYGKTRNKADFEKWLLRASREGSAGANYVLGRRSLLAGYPHEALGYLSRSLTISRVNNWAAVWYYIARATLGQKDIAAREIGADIKIRNADWPYPILEYYLGNITISQLLESAKGVRNGECEVRYYAERKDGLKAASVEPQKCVQP